MNGAVKIYAGARSPESLTITWQRRDPSFTTSDVSSAVLVLSDGSQWDCTVISSTESTVVVEHVFDVGGVETGQPGGFEAGLMLLDSGGGLLRRSEPMSLTILKYPVMTAG